MSGTTYHEGGPELAHDPRIYLRYAARARRLQSEAIGRGFGTAGRFLARIGADARRRMVSAVRKRRTMAELSRLDDHTLADVGIDRAQIPVIAQGLIAPSGEAPRRIIPVAPCRPGRRGDAANDVEPPSAAA